MKRTLLTLTILWGFSYFTLQGKNFYPPDNASFQQALDSAGRNFEADTIFLDSSVYQGPFTLNRIDSFPLVLLGRAPDTTIIYGGGGSSALSIRDSSGGSIFIKGLYFLNGFSDFGGAVSLRGYHDSVYGDLKFRNCLFGHSRAINHGGAIYLSNARFENVNFSNCLFHNNNADSSGGAIFISGEITSVDLFKNKFSDNISASGGGINILPDEGSILHVDSNTFIFNEASAGDGGAIYLPVEVAGFSAVIERNTFTKNSANSAFDDGNGGAVALIVRRDSLRENLVFIFEENTFFENSGIRGGAFSFEFPFSGEDTLSPPVSIRFYSNLIDSNNARYQGGGLIFSSYGSVSADFQNNTFIENRSMEEGGGGAFFRYGNNPQNLVLHKNLFFGNTLKKTTGALFGGGLLLVGDSAGPGVEASIRGNIFEKNNAVYGGGVAFITNGDTIPELQIYNNRFDSNQAVINGGGLYYAGRKEFTFLIDSCRFKGNRALTGSGGGVFIHPSGREHFVLVANSDFQGNSAEGKGVSGRGGAVFFSPVSDTFTYPSITFVLRKNLLDSNYGLTGGGAFIKMPQSSKDTILVNSNRITGNMGTGNGGGLSLNCDSCIFLLTNNLFTRNSANINSAVSITANSILLNNTIFGNSSVNGGGVAVEDIRNRNYYHTFANNIIYSNLPKDLYLFGIYPENSIEVKLFNNDYGTLQQNYITLIAEDNISLDPEFSGPSSFELSKNSPCINKGRKGFGFLPQEDILGMPRITGDFPDMGAFESPYLSGISGDVEREIQLFPQPTSDYINLVLPKTSKEVVVSTLEGKALLSKQISDTGNLRLNVSDFKAGIYIIRIKMDGEVYTRKFMKI